MGEITGISWTDHTFNPWWGCTKVSEACRNCYAETTDKRGLLDGGVSHWGVKAPRRFFGDKHWSNPEKWNRKAEQDGVRRRVFVASMADWAEDREDLKPHRARLWRLIDRCRHLDWLLLSKRHERIAQLLPWGAGDVPWSHVWLGVTAEDSQHMAERVIALRHVNAAVRFVSCEPILEFIGAEILEHALAPRTGLGSMHWMIVGDESGHGARPASVDWVRVARDVATRNGVAFHFKQWAGADADGIDTIPDRKGRKIHLPVLDGRQWAEFPR